MSQTEELSLVERGESITIQNPAEYEAAAEYLKGVAQLMDRIKADYAPLKKKAYDAHKEVCRAETEKLKPLEAVVSRIKGLMLGWQRLQAKLAEKERARLQAQADKRAAKTGVPAPVIQATQAAPAVQGMNNRVTWSCEVIDASKLPREYLQPDMAKLNEAARRMKEEFNIAGARAVSDTNLVVRT
jgi:hypothetical protein